MTCQPVAETDRSKTSPEFSPYQVARIANATPPSAPPIAARLDTLRAPLRRKRLVARIDGMRQIQVVPSWRPRSPAVGGDGQQLPERLKSGNEEGEYDFRGNGQGGLLQGIIEMTRRICGGSRRRRGGGAGMDKRGGGEHGFAVRSCPAATSTERNETRCGVGVLVVVAPHTKSQRFQLVRP